MTDKSGTGIKTFKAQSFNEILEEASTLPGVDDPEIAALLAALGQDPGFVMIGFAAQPANEGPEPQPEHDRTMTE